MLHQRTNTHQGGDTQDGAASKQTSPVYGRRRQSRVDLDFFPGHASNSTLPFHPPYEIIFRSCFLNRSPPLMHTYIHRSSDYSHPPHSVLYPMRFKKCSRDVLPMLKDNIVHATTHHNFYFIFSRYSSGGFLPTYNTHRLLYPLFPSRHRK